MSDDNISSLSGRPGQLVRELATSAKYYPPGVYSGALKGAALPSFLTFHRDLEITADPAAAGFIPMSSVPARGRNTKLFAVGILPPSMTLDPSLMLDRSATVPDFSGRSTARVGAVTSADAQDLGVPLGISDAGRGLIAKFEGSRLTAYRDSGGKLTIGIGHTGPEVTEGLVWTQEQVDAQFARDVATFEKVVSGSVKVPITQGQYDVLVSLAYNIGPTRFRNSTLLQKLNADDMEGASAEFPAFRMVEGKVSAVLVKRRASEREIFDQETLAPDNPVPVGGDAEPGTFADFGSSNARSFRQGLAQRVDLVDPKQLVSQRSYVMAAKAALDAMSNTPPLRLLVNPNSFSVKAQKIVSDANWGRNGPIIEFWGDDQDKISGAGKVAAFYALDSKPTLGRGGPGLTRSARNVSLAWQNFQSLYLLYRNNGGLYLSDLSQQDRDVLLTTVGSVYLFYDNILYIGCFDSFNLTESDEQPFSAEYSFEFTVRAAFLLEFTEDFNYGGGPAFSRNTLGAGLPTQSGVRSTESIADIAAAGGSVVAANDVQGAVNAAADFVIRTGTEAF